MRELALKDAETCLADLVAEAAGGEEILITLDDGTTLKLVLVSAPRPRPKYGSARAFVEIGDDFDEPLEDFKPYEL